MKYIVKIKHAIILVMIVALGLMFRIVDLDKQSLWIDEGYTLNGAMAIVDHGYPQLDSGELYVNNLFTTYTTAIVLKTGLFDAFSPWAGRLPFAIFGALLIFAVFYLAKTVFEDHRVALLSAFVTAFSYWEIAWSRQIRGYAACAFFLVLALIYIWRYMESGRVSRFFIALSAAVAGGLFHLVGFAILPVIISIGLTRFFSGKKDGLIDKKLFYSLAAVFIVEMTLVFIFIDNPFTRIAHLFGSTDILFSVGVVLSVVLGVFIKESSKKVIFLTLIFLNMFSAIVLFSPTIYSRYVFILMPVAILLFCSGVVSFGSLLLKSPTFKYSLIALTTLFFTSTIIQWYPQSFYDLEKDSPQPNFGKAFSIIQSMKSDDDVIISIYPVLNNIYLGEKGLAIDRPLENSNLLKSDESGLSEYYVGATLIKDAFELKDILDKKHGFVVSERLFYQILGDKLDVIQNNPKVRPIYESGDSEEDRIKLYRF